MTITEEDKKAFYDAQLEVNPDARKEGLLPEDGEQVGAGSRPDGLLSEQFQMLGDVGEALDCPEYLVVGEKTVTVTSPCLNDIINLFKRLAAEQGGFDKAAEKAGEMAESAESQDMNSLLKAFPQARSVFLSCIRVEGGEAFTDEDAKWRWFSQELDALDAIEIMDMFTERTDWVRLIGKVRRIMGKFLGLAKQARVAGRK